MRKQAYSDTSFLEENTKNLYFDSRRVRYGRYMGIVIFPTPHKAELRFSHDSCQWNCITLTRHELLKLRRLIDKALSDSRLGSSFKANFK